MDEEAKRTTPLPIHLEVKAQVMAERYLVTPPNHHPYRTFRTVREWLPYCRYWVREEERLKAAYPSIWKNLRERNSE